MEDWTEEDMIAYETWYNELHPLTEEVMEDMVRFFEEEEAREKIKES